MAKAELRTWRFTVESILASYMHLVVPATYRIERMQKLIRVVLVCYGLLGVLCVSMIVVARTRPWSEIIVPELGSCEDTLCYMGIKPNVTSAFDAQSILNNAPKLSSVPALLLEPPTMQWAIKLSELVDRIILFPAVVDQSIVGQVDLTLKPATIDAGRVVAQLGPPCAVGLSLNTVVLVYPTSQFIFQTNTNRLQVTSRLAVISLLGSKYSFCQGAGILPHHYVWRGFHNYFISVN